MCLPDLSCRATSSVPTTAPNLEGKVPVIAVPSWPQAWLLRKGRISKDKCMEAAWEPTTSLPFLFLHPHRVLQPLKMKGMSASSHSASVGKWAHSVLKDLNDDSSSEALRCSLTLPAGEKPSTCSNLWWNRLLHIYLRPWELYTKMCMVLCPWCESNTVFLKFQITEPLQEQINIDFLDWMVSCDKFSHNSGVQSRHQTSSPFTEGCLTWIHFC